MREGPRICWQLCWGRGRRAHEELVLAALLARLPGAGRRRPREAALGGGHAPMALVLWKCVCDMGEEVKEVPAIVSVDAVSRVQEESQPPPVTGLLKVLSKSEPRPPPKTATALGSRSTAQPSRQKPRLHSVLAPRWDTDEGQRDLQSLCDLVDWAGVQRAAEEADAEAMRTRRSSAPEQWQSAAVAPSWWSAGGMAGPLPSMQPAAVGGATPPASSSAAAATALLARSLPESPLQRGRPKDELAVRLLGTWLYGSEPLHFQITRSAISPEADFQLRFRGHKQSAEVVYGLLSFQEDGWHVGALVTHEGARAGQVRLRPVDKDEAVAFSFGSASQLWGPDAMARRPLMLEDLEGSWCFKPFEEPVATLDAQGRAEYFGRRWAPEHDLFEDGTRGAPAIRRRDGWSVHPERSSIDMLVWCKAGEESITWRRVAEKSLVDPVRVLILVREDGRNLRRAAVELRSDRQLVLAAVSQNSQALAYVAEQLRRDPEVLHAAGSDRAALREAGGARASLLPRPAVGAGSMVPRGREPVPPLPKALCERVSVVVPAARAAYIVERQLCDLVQLLEPHRRGCLTAYSDHGPSNLPPDSRRGVSASGFTLLELDGGAVQLSIERSDGALELILGEGEAARSYMLLFGAGGRERRLPVGCAATSPAAEEKLPARLLGTAAGLPQLLLADVADWLLGPVALAWGNLPDFSAELSKFLRTGRLSPELQSLLADASLVAKGVRVHGLWLRHASEARRADRRIVALAVQQNGLALEFAAAHLRADAGVVGEAMSQDARAWRFAAESLRCSPELVATEDRRGYTALICAAAGGHGVAVAELLAASADTRHAAEESGQTALIAAAAGAHGAVVVALLKARVEPNGADRGRDSALSWAAKSGLLEAVQCLLEAQADPRPANRDGKTALIHAAEAGHSAIVGRLLLNRANADHVGSGGSTALMAAAYSGNLGLAAQLLAARANVHRADDEGNTALLWAARHGHGTVLQRLLEAHAAVEGSDVDGTTALIWSARMGHSGAVTQLLRAHADCHAEGLRGFSALSWAAQNGHTLAVNALLRARAEISHLDDGGNTPLVLATVSGHALVVSQLLLAGNYGAQGGPRALELAKAEALVRLLRAAKSTGEE